jgi:hypothetical protein
MRKIAQSGYFEFPEISPPLREGFTSRVGIHPIHPNSQVGELFRREVGTRVAFDALAFAVEEVQTILLPFGKRRFIAGELAIVGGISGH